MSYADSKALLTDVLRYKYSDSLLTSFRNREIIYKDIIGSQENRISLLTSKVNNEREINLNLKSIMTNRDRELEIANEVIDKQKKEIKRQKLKKVLGFISTGAITILTLLLTK